MRRIALLAVCGGVLAALSTAAVGQLLPGSPHACSVTVITTGGTAVTAITGPINGATITNGINAGQQGIATAEELFVDMVNSPGSTDGASNGTTTSLAATGQSITIPPMILAVNSSGVAVTPVVRVNAATSAHKFSCVQW